MLQILVIERSTMVSLLEMVDYVTCKYYTFIIIQKEIFAYSELHLLRFNFYEIGYVS